MNILSEITILFLIFTCCNALSNINSSKLFRDNVYPISDGCYDLIDLNRCPYGCKNENYTEECFCYSLWDAFCCATRMVGHYCNADDQKNWKKFLDESTENHEKGECVQWKRKSLKCSGSIKLFGNSILIIALIKLISII